MSLPQNGGWEPGQSLPPEPQNRGVKAIATVALVIAVVSLILSIYLLGVTPSLDSRIDDLESQVSALESTASDLESRISELENLTDGGVVEPDIQLAPADPMSSNEYEVQVVGVSRVTDLENWKVILIRNGTMEATMDPLATGTSGNITFTDIGGEGKLTVGDRFILTCVPGSSYSLSIIWKDSGNVRGSVDWWTP